jgi:hypothetical protein
MKRVILVLSLVSALVLMSATSIFATEDIVSTEYLPDGSYIEMTVEDQYSPFSLFAAASIKNGYKTATYKNSAGTSLWYVKVSGTFTYNGSTSSCTSSSITATSHSSFWTIVSKSSSKRGNMATASATVRQYDDLGFLIQTVTRTVNLTCSATGTLS